MESYKKFLEDRILIGKGAMSSVFLWNKKAYKCFDDNYPKTWIDYEYKVQNEICKSKLNVPKYYKCSFKNTIKMDYIDGKTTADMISIYGKDKVLEDFINYQEKIHEVKDLDLEELSSFLRKQIRKANITDIQKKNALAYLTEINKTKEDKVLCHMDYHFLNTMYMNEEIYVIDWIDAKIGKAILDYARTYVITYEYAPGFKNKYLKQILKRNNYNKELFKKAVYVNAINRIVEHDSKRIRKLLDELD